MAHVWFVGEKFGQPDTRHVFTAPVAMLAERIQLAPRHWVSGLESGPAPVPGSDFGRNQSVVLKVDKDDAEPQGGEWRPGFYRPIGSTEEAYERLKGHATEFDFQGNVVA